MQRPIRKPSLQVESFDALPSARLLDGEGWVVAADASLALYCQRAFEILPNTAPFDVTGHPALTVPCGMVEGLPVGMMLVARHWNETTIYQAAQAFEQSGDWRQM